MCFVWGYIGKKRSDKELITYTQYVLCLGLYQSKKKGQRVDIRHLYIYSIGALIGAVSDKKGVTKPL